MLSDLPPELIAHVVDWVGRAHGLLALTRLTRVSREFKALAGTRTFRTFGTKPYQYAGRSTSACMTMDGKVCTASPNEVVVYDDDGTELLRMPITVVANNTDAVIPPPHAVVTSAASYIFVSITCCTKTFNVVLHSATLNVITSFTIHGPFFVSFHRNGFDVFNPVYGPAVLHLWARGDTVPSNRIPLPMHLVAVVRHEDALYTLDVHGRVRMLDPVRKRLHAAFDWRVPDPVSMTMVGRTLVVGGRRTLAAFTLDGTLVRRDLRDSDLTNVTACGDTLVVVENERVVKLDYAGEEEGDRG